MAKYTTRNKALNRLQLKLPEFRFFSSASYYLCRLFWSSFTRAYFDLALHVGVPLRILHELCRVRI